MKRFILLMTFVSLQTLANSSFIVHTTQSKNYGQCLMQVAEMLTIPAGDAPVYEVDGYFAVNTNQIPPKTVSFNFLALNTQSGSLNLYKLEIDSTSATGWTVGRDRDGLFFSTASVNKSAKLFNRNGDRVGRVDIRFCRAVLDPAI